MEREELRIGTGFDSHPLVSGRKLILGGVNIPYEKGLSGWSDADVATHAVIDALCGAADLGDIGTLFPSQEQEYKDSAHIVDHVARVDDAIDKVIVVPGRCQIGDDLLIEQCTENVEQP